MEYDIPLQLWEFVVNWYNFCCGFVPCRDLIKDLGNKKAVKSADIATKLLKDFSNVVSKRVFLLIWTIVQRKTAADEYKKVKVRPLNTKDRRAKKTKL